MQIQSSRVLNIAEKPLVSVSRVSLAPLVGKVSSQYIFEPISRI